MRNLLKSYGSEQFPNLPPFNDRDLNLTGSDNILYNFVSYHSLMNEIKRPTTTDKKIHLMTQLLINLRRKVTMATAMVTELYGLDISSSCFPLQESVDSPIYEWDKFSNFANFHDKWQIESMKSLKTSLSYFKIAKTILVKRSQSPITMNQWLGSLDEFVNLSSEKLPVHSDWDY